ncbi:Follicle-stimulating hormone receptor [Halotydeus destructor]|nr:Follicle-stimulating hormone receptor [Halotydeus destructor]
MVKRTTVVKRLTLVLHFVLVVQLVTSDGQVPNEPPSSNDIDGQPVDQKDNTGCPVKCHCNDSIVDCIDVDLTELPNNLAHNVRKLIVKSNRISSLPILDTCVDLRLIDLSYNEISTLGDRAMFHHQGKLIDLFLGHNSIKEIHRDSFQGLKSLHVLELENNGVEFIHSEAFSPLTQLRDLNLGKNEFPVLPTNGLQNLRQIKTFGNPVLKDFPEPETFPKLHILAVSYAYHCCPYLPLKNPPTYKPPSLEETILWMKKEDIDLSLWSTNGTADLWPLAGNGSDLQFRNGTGAYEDLNNLLKTYGKDYHMPENLEEYYEDYKSTYGNMDDQVLRYPVQCLPEPGPFMPCEDLFGWWTLRCGVWIVFLLALLGNGIVVIVLLFGRSKVDVPRFLVCNLALADFFMGVYLGMLAIVDAATLGEFRAYAIPWQTSWACQLAGFLGVLSSELSVFTLAVITLERNYAITHAMHLNKRLSLKHAAYIMTIGWAFALTMAMLPLVGVSDYRKFAVCLPFEIDDSKWSLGYIIFLIIINGVAFLVLMGCYLRMYCAIRGSQAWNSNDSRIAKRMALLVFTDFLCWAPIAFFSLTAVSGYNLVSLEEAKVFTIFVLPLNSCANPFLYAIFTKQFKRDCVMLCKRLEESRVTRGIGRCRHSSNFSNRHTTQANSNSAIDKRGSGSGSQSDNLVPINCNCAMSSSVGRKLPLAHEPLMSSPTAGRDHHPLHHHYHRHAPSCPASVPRPGRIRQAANRWFGNGKKQAARADSTDSSSCPNSSQLASGGRLGPGKRTSFSSDTFSSRSDSWRNQGHIPMRLLVEKKKRQRPVSGAVARRSSWAAAGRSSSHESTMDSSRRDSSTFRTYTRSSVSSNGSSKPNASFTDSTSAASGLTSGDPGGRPVNLANVSHPSRVHSNPSTCVELDQCPKSKVSASCNEKPSIIRQDAILLSSGPASNLVQPDIHLAGTLSPVVQPTEPKANTRIRPPSGRGLGHHHHGRLGSDCKETATALGDAVVNGELDHVEEPDIPEESDDQSA